ncbi:MAG: DUF1295 domain-containing protein [Bacillota bacterium]
MNIYIQLALVLFSYFVLFFLLGTIKKDNSLVDIAWGLGFVVSVLYTLIVSDFNTVNLLITFMVSIWGLRLSWHIFQRKLGKPEDFRYRKWREEWNYFYLRSFFQIYLLQGLLLFIIVYPALTIITTSIEQIRPGGYLGILVWFTGLAVEVISDRQLKKFLQTRSDKSKIMDSGLWKYSRHPNYFGETLVWWGIFIFALSATGNIFTIISPLLITILLLYVSGVPLLEEHFADNPQYQEYAEKTNKFFPWFPKN